MSLREPYHVSQKLFKRPSYIYMHTYIIYIHTYIYIQSEHLKEPLLVVSRRSSLQHPIVHKMKLFEEPYVIIESHRSGDTQRRGRAKRGGKAKPSGEEKRSGDATRNGKSQRRGGARRSDAKRPRGAKRRSHKAKGRAGRIEASLRSGGKNRDG